jgi:HSP20 family protein
MSDDSEDLFDDVDKFYQRLTKKMFGEMKDIEDAIRSGKLEGEWDIKPIEEPNVKGYIARGRFEFGDEKPLKTLTLPKQISEEQREPLTDIFQGNDSVKLYVELPGVEKTDIKLNVTPRHAEIKAKNFSKTVDLPNLDLEVNKATANYKNGVLEVTIPRTEKIVDKDHKKTIKIE